MEDELESDVELNNLEGANACAQSLEVRMHVAMRLMLVPLLV